MKQQECYVTGSGDRIKILINRSDGEVIFYTIIVSKNAIHVAADEILDLSNALLEIAQEVENEGN